MYRVFYYKDGRRRRLERIDRKRISRWDDAMEPARWKTAAAAHMWGKRQGFQFGYEVCKE